MRLDVIEYTEERFFLPDLWQEELSSPFLPQEDVHDYLLDLGDS
jgi:hypothetical protein